MGLLEWERTITCPYNAAHQITQPRMQRHLVKCRKNNPTSEYVICPLNQTHHILKPEYKYHLDNCPDRKIVELVQYDFGKVKAATPPDPTPQVNNSSRDFLGHLEAVDEDWEKEIRDAPLKSYDPQKQSEKKPVLRRLHGATPSERRKFREAERTRLRGLTRSAPAEEEETLGVSEGAQEKTEQSGDSNTRVRTTLTRPSQLLPSPAPSLARPGDGPPSTSSCTSSLVSMGPGRQGSITSRLLKMVDEKMKSAGDTKDESLHSQLGRIAVSTRTPPPIKE